MRGSLSNTVYFSLCFLTSSTIFLADYSLPLGVAGGVPYAVLPIISLWSQKHRHIFFMAILGSLLTVLGYYLSPSGGVPWVVLTNRGIAIFIIWATAILVSEFKRSEEYCKKVGSEQAEKFISSFLDLTAIDYFNTEDSLKRLTEVASNTLNVDRASVWFYNEDKTSITLQNMYKRSTDTHKSGACLDSKDYPSYFRAIATAQILDADNAREDPRTSEFASSYLQPLNIYSMLDAPIRFNGKVCGVLCHEHTGSPRKWTNEEKVFAVSIGDIISHIFEALERQKTETALRESEKNLKEAQSIAHIGSWSWNVGANTIECSDETYRLYGYGSDKKALVLDDFTNSIHADDREMVITAVNKTLKEKEKYNISHRVIGSDGIERTIHVQGEVYSNSSGKATRMVGTAIDVTEQKRYENELKDKNIKLEMLGQCSRILFHAEREQDLLDDICRVVVEIGGYSLAWIGFVELDANKSITPVGQYGFEDGYLENLDLSWANIQHEQEPTGACIREVKPFVMQNIITNPIFKQGRSAAIKKGYHSSVGVPLISKGTVYGALTVYSSDPTDFDEEDVLLLSNLAADLALGIMLFRAREERDVAEKALRDREAKYRSLMDNASDAIIITDTEGGLKEANKKALKLLGYYSGEIWNMHFTDIHPEETHEKLVEEYRRLLDGKNSMSIRNTMVKRRDGSSVPVDISGSIINLNETNVVQMILRDITERKLTEKQTEQHQQEMIHADKMKSLGVLVAGVAHEVNNPNTFIMMNAPLLKLIWNGSISVLDEYHDENGDFSLGGLPFEYAKEAVPKLIQGIIDGSDRIKATVDKLKDFTHSDETAQKLPANISNIVESAANLVESLINKNTKYFSTTLDRNLPKITCHYYEIEQVIINLINNACQSLESMDKKVSINTYYDSEISRVVVAVSEEGVGIVADNIAKITDPFFSTKQSSGGTGLGLSVSLNIVKDHGGELQFKSKPGEGTTALLYLPAEKDN